MRQRTGVLHRLLGHSVRTRMAGPTRLWALGVAAFAVERAWAFDPIDSSTWANACVGHVQAVGAHARAVRNSLIQDPQ